MNGSSLTKRGKTSRLRRGAAVVEMAVVLPLLLTLVFGIIEFGWTFMVYQNVTNAAREGCRVAVLAGSEDTDINERIDTFMGLVGLSDYDVTLTHPTPGDPTETVVISVPYSSISLVGEYFGAVDFDIVARSSMRKESAD